MDTFALSVTEMPFPEEEEVLVMERSLKKKDPLPLIDSPFPIPLRIDMLWNGITDGRFTISDNTLFNPAPDI